MDSKTIEILKSFADINQGILIREGNTLRTMAVSKNIFGKAEVPTTFPKEFAIYNLKELLAVLSLFKEPDVEYMEQYLKIKEGRNTVKYFYSSPAVVVSPPADKDIPKKDVVLSFSLKKEDFSDLIKATGTLRSTDLIISKKGVTAVTKNGGDNSYSIDIEGVDGESDDKFTLKVGVLSGVIPSDFRVSVSPRVVFFESESDSLTYTFALEKE